MELVCSRCRQSKSVTEFSPRQNRRRGYTDRCKQCLRSFAGRRGNHRNLEYFDAFIRYDPETGLFFWRKDRSNVFAGHVAGNIGPNGYRTICIEYVIYYAHHLAWLFTHRTWPSGVIDHQDGDKSNNRPDNLRDTTQSQNGLNRKCLNKNNTSGVIGVSFDKKRRKFAAQIMINRKMIHLGRFDRFEDAAAAREKAHADFTRG